MTKTQLDESFFSQIPIPLTMLLLSHNKTWPKFIRQCQEKCPNTFFATSDWFIVHILAVTKINAFHVKVEKELIIRFLVYRLFCQILTTEMNAVFHAIYFNVISLSCMFTKEGYSGLTPTLNFFWETPAPCQI